MMSLVVLCLIYVIGLAQDSIQYTADFDFYDGLYLDFEDFRNDNPIPFESVISTYSVNDPMFLEQMLADRDITYRDRFDEVRTVSINDIWGYARNGRPYVCFTGSRYLGLLVPDQRKRKNEDNFGKFIIIGQLCVFQVNMLTHRDPTNILSGAWDTNQLFFSIRERRVADYNGPEFERLIADDPELLKEFVALDLDEKKKRMFSYVLRYNQRHPLYFPFHE